VFLTGKPAKPIPSLTPIYPKHDNQYDSDPRMDQNGDDEPVVDVTQFLSISLQPDEDNSSNISKSHQTQYKSHNSNEHQATIDMLRRRCSFMHKELQKRDATIKSMQHQMRAMRKKMDSISVKKILNDSFKGITYDILENYLNNTNLDSCEKTYSVNVKEFAMKLYASSAEAYALVRAQFDLPHPANVSHWLRSATTEEEIYETSPQEASSAHDGSEDQDNTYDNGDALDESFEDGQPADEDKQSEEMAAGEPCPSSSSSNFEADELHIKMEPIEACD
jgi:hypothetical protein